MLNKVYTLVDTRHYSENSGPRITELQTNVFVTLMTVFTEILFSPAEASSDDLGLLGIIFQNSLMLVLPVGLLATCLRGGLSLHVPELLPQAHKCE